MIKTMAHPYNEILLSNLKKRAETIDTHNIEDYHMH